MKAMNTEVRCEYFHTSINPPFGSPSGGKSNQHTIGTGKLIIIKSVTTSLIANALCNLLVSTQCSFSTIVLVQYAEKSVPQMKRIERKNESVQRMITKIINQVTTLNRGAALRVKTRR